MAFCLPNQTHLCLFLLVETHAARDTFSGQLAFFRTILSLTLSDFILSGWLKVTNFLRNLPPKTLYNLSITLGDTIDFAHTLYMDKDTKTLTLTKLNFLNFLRCIN